MGGLFSVVEELPAILGAAEQLVTVGFVALGYLFTAIDRLRPGGLTKDDGQVGIKLVLFGVMLAGVLIATNGATTFLRLLLVGFEGGSRPVREALPSIIVGGLILLIVAKVLLPRTNVETARQPERYFLGAIGAIYGALSVVAISGLLNGVFLDAGWKPFTAGRLASVVVFTTTAVFAITRLGKLSGWAAPPPPPRPQQPPPQAQPPGGGYPPQGGGGYNPQGGGYNPQGGGGYNPQGGGGYNPQGGGGHNPQGGGGYNPQGGGGQPR